MGKNCQTLVFCLNNLMMFTGGVCNVIFAVKFFNFSSCILGLTEICGNHILQNLIAFLVALPFAFISKIKFFSYSSQIAILVIFTTGNIKLL